MRIDLRHHSQFILKPHLAVHNINICFFLSVCLKMKEDRVIEELADWFLVIIEIEERVNEC